MPGHGRKIPRQGPSSDQNIFDYPGGELIRQPFAEAVPIVDQVAEVHSQKMQQCRVLVVDADWVLGRMVAKLVCRPVHDSALDAAAG